MILVLPLCNAVDLLNPNDDRTETELGMTVNPSHILIARNSRSHNNPSASLSSPTETHAAAAGIFRSAGSPPWSSESAETDIETASELSTDDFEESIEVDPTFLKSSKFPGNVKIVVQGTTFW